MRLKFKQPKLVSSRRGLTLVEVLVVTAIIAIVTAIAWMAIAGRVKAAAKRTVLKSELRQIAVALNIYRGDNDDAFPSNWRSLGYYGVNKKDKFGRGFPPQDVYYDKAPSYGVEYHTPECAAPPAASPVIWVFRQFAEAYASKPRFNTMDLDRTQAIQFSPSCLPNSFGKHPFSYLKGGTVHTVQLRHVKSLGVDVSGAISYQWIPDWYVETNLEP